MYKSKLRKSVGSFKPPRTSTGGESSSVGDAKVGSNFTQEDIMKMRNKEKELDEKIEALKKKGYKTEELQDYIQLLHDYNDVKDAAQMFMGHIAVYERLTYRHIAERYNAPKSD